MATQVQFRGGTTTEHASFNGAAREVTVDTTKQTLVVQDGSTNGGFPLLGEKNADNVKVYFGTGDDLQIYHNGSHNYVYGSTSGQNVTIGTKSGYINLQPVDNEEGIIVKNNGAVEAYYDNSKKFETTSDGVNVTGILQCDEFKLLDGEHAKFGTGEDLRIYHDGSHSYITEGGTGFLILKASEVQIQSDSGEDQAKFVPDGAVELYFDNSKKFETTSIGVNITGGDAGGSYIVGDMYWDNGTNAGRDVHWDQSANTWQFRDDVKLTIGNSNDLLLMHDGTDNIIDAQNNASIRIRRGGYNVWEFGDNSFKGNDGRKIILGDGSDLQLFHESNISTIKDNYGDLRIMGNTIRIQRNAGGENFLYATEGGKTSLYFDGSEKLETASHGITALGDVFFDNQVNAGKDIYWDESADRLSFNDNVHATFGNGEDLRIYHDGADSWINSATGNVALKTTNAGHISIKTNDELAIFCSANGGISLYYDGVKRFETLNYGGINYGTFEVNADVANNYALKTIHEGNSADRLGHYIQVGADDAANTNYAMTIADGDGTQQGYVTFSGGTVSYGAFRAHHPCIVPDSENPSDSSNAYPYGTLLETISIQYSQKNGADTERGIRYKVQKTQSANSRKVLGAYGSSMNGGPDGQTNEHQALVLGDGHILVNNAGGNIEVGDGICSSATAGIGQKATANPSMVIGIAQEAVTFTGSETKLVAVQYGLQQFTPWS